MEEGGGEEPVDLGKFGFDKIIYSTKWFVYHKVIC